MTSLIYKVSRNASAKFACLLDGERIVAEGENFRQHSCSLLTITISRIAGVRLVFGNSVFFLQGSSPVQFFGEQVFTGLNFGESFSITGRPLHLEHEENFRCRVLTRILSLLPLSTIFGNNQPLPNSMHSPDSPGAVMTILALLTLVSRTGYVHLPQIPVRTKVVNAL
jgi:hypothetical protein